jgi:protein SCO1/2
MNTKKILLLLLSAFVSFALLNLTSCQPQPHERVHSPTEKHYDLKGKVVSVDKTKREITVAHEDIKDYMPGMTMPFRVKDDWVFEIASPGNQITASLVVDGTQSFLEDVVLTEDTAQVSSTPLPAEVQPGVGTQVPDFRLLNQDGKVIRIADYKGKALLVTFIYTRCQDPTQCTLMSSNFAAIDKELQNRPDLFAKTHLLSVSFDAAYDTPKVLRSYGAAYTGKYEAETFAHWEFAGGSEDEVKGITKFFGMRYYQDSTSGNEQVVHSLRTAVIGPDGKIFIVYRGNDWTVAEMLKQLELAANGSQANPAKQ